MFGLLCNSSFTCFWQATQSIESTQQQERLWLPVRYTYSAELRSCLQALMFLTMAILILVETSLLQTLTTTPIRSISRPLAAPPVSSTVSFENIYWSIWLSESHMLPQTCKRLVCLRCLNDVSTCVLQEISCCAHLTINCILTSTVVPERQLYVLQGRMLETMTMWMWVVTRLP